MRLAVDHIVVLVSEAEFENPPLWLANNFTIIEGGTHARGTSRNKLIVFKDGTYVELFSWVSGQDRSDFPAWAGRPEGEIIDFALTNLPEGSAESSHGAMNERLRHISEDDFKVQYDDLRVGGRRRMDGQQLSWKTTRPRALEDKASWLDVPFFCHDTTQRRLRVPCDDDTVTTHPCGVVGLATIDLGLPKSLFERYQKVYEAVFDATSGPEQASNERLERFTVGSPNSDYAMESTVTIKATEQEDKSRQEGSDGSRYGVQRLCFRVPKDINTTQLDKEGLGSRFYLVGLD